MIFYGNFDAFLLAEATIIFFGFISYILLYFGLYWKSLSFEYLLLYSLLDERSPKFLFILFCFLYTSLYFFLW